jgi:mono/diheme cytochrome c family protein
MSRNISREFRFQEYRPANADAGQEKKAMAAVFDKRALALGAAIVIASSFSASAENGQVARGRYLVSISGCSDCHTPGGMSGSPDMKRYLGGSDVGFAVPGAGVFVGQNLTPDKETGLGNWTNAQIVTAIRTGKRPDGVALSPVMPWPGFAHLSDGDASAIANFLKSLPAVANKAPGPFKAGDKVTVSVSAVLPADAFNALPAALK